MDKYEIKLVKQYVFDKIPIILDQKTQELKYDTRNIYYKIYKYIKELENGSDKE